MLVCGVIMMDSYILVMFESITFILNKFWISLYLI